MRVLDVGCGTGEKARYLAENGAHSVLGIDASTGFAQQWKEHTAATANLRLTTGSFDQLGTHPILENGSFDLVVCFQALMYSTTLTATVSTFRDLLREGGTLAISVPHPFRFAILKNEREGWPHGKAYQRTDTYRYPSPWKADILLEHAMPRISDYLNAFAEAGFRLVSCEEPGVTEAFRDLSPEKAEWMDRYVGIVAFRLTKRN